MSIYQFVPFARPKVMLRLMQSLPSGVVPVLDLEDCFLDVNNPGRSTEHKAIGRRALNELCSPSHGPMKKKRRVAIRLNQPGTSEYDKDLPIAYSISKTFEQLAVIVPKIESADQFELARDSLKMAGVNHLDLMPILETIKSHQNIQDIIAAVDSSGCKSVIFGFHDYCLDAGFWPFPDPDEKLYWDILRSFAEPTVSMGLRFIAPPISDLRSEELLTKMVLCLQELCGDRLDIFSVGMDQSSSLLSLMCNSSTVAKILETIQIRPKLDLIDQKRLAMDIRQSYEQNKRNEHSYAVDVARGRFISPHMYLAALKFLETINHDQF